MLNRRQLRIKVLEVVYAYDKSSEKDLEFQIKYFLKSNQNFYKLYITCFSLLNELLFFSKNLHSKNQNKYLINEKDFSLGRFCNNQILNKIFESDWLNQKINDFEIDYWSNYSELIFSVWKDIIDSEISLKYFKITSSSFESDQSYLINIYRKSIAPNKKLYEFFEDKEISWINDLPLVNSLVLSSIKNMKKNSKKFLFMKDIYKNKEDADFGVHLIKKVIENKSFLEDEISKVTLNWDNDRIAQIDLLLLQMCLAEFLYFKSIPVKVSINEYLEIAKEYSSKKSNVFINGILDKLSKNYIKQGTLKKNKRGLQ
ncbi:MAG: transcription antitermination factor NusB [Flavobacteriaceae bacterium]|nr:transcription antitermination factor NusB [Flavobacteriaceae bacterium]